MRPYHFEHLLASKSNSSNIEFTQNVKESVLTDTIFQIFSHKLYFTIELGIATLDLLKGTRLELKKKFFQNWEALFNFHLKIVQNFSLFDGFPL